jgi:pyrrolidone-carboxylate peptidase
MAFYASLYYQKIHQLKAKIGFIHFPLYEGQSNEQVLPTLSLDEMVIILEKIILNL